MDAQRGSKTEHLPLTGIQKEMLNFNFYFELNKHFIGIFTLVCEVVGHNS